MTSFAALVDAFLKQEFDESPVAASSLGLTEYDEKLDDLSAAAFARRRAADLEWLRRFRAVPDEEFAAGERIDRDLLVSVLRGREIAHPLEMWRRQPATYLNPGLNGVFTLFLHRLRPEPDLADAARSRLEQTPRSIRDGIANLDWSRTPRVYVDRAVGQARAGATYARALVPAEVRDPKLREYLAEAGAKAAEAFEEFGRFLESNREKAAGDYAIGEQMYTALLREKELLPYEARGLRERGHEQYAFISAEMRGLAQEIDGTEDFFAVLARLNRQHAPTPEGMRAEYAEWTERARSFLRDTGLVTLPPGERCLVEPSPHFQRPILAVASYNAPPPFSDSLTGHFFVPYPPDGTGEPEVQQRLEGNCTPGIPTTAVHEAYPGHHWHLVMRRANPSKVRKVYGTSYFTEGWALYAERVMREQGFFERPETELYQWEATLFRAARIVVDTSLHLREMTFDEAVDFMMRKANLTQPNAKAEVGRYCSWPTQASSYLTGMLEIVDIRARYLKRWAAGGKGSARPGGLLLARAGRNDTETLRAFHDALASSGALPTALAERAIAE